MLPSTVIVADDHPLFRAALVQALLGLMSGVRVIEVDRFESLRAAVEQAPEAELVLLDLHMPGAKGFSSLLYLRNEHPALPVVVVSGHEDPAVMRRALDFGASGFIPKSAGLPVLSEALNRVTEGGIWVPSQLQGASVSQTDRDQARRIASLSPQQFRVFMMLAEGFLNKQIAYEIHVTEATVKAHVTAILRKLGLVRRTQAALLAQRLMQAEAASLEVPAPEGNDDDE